MSDFLYIIMGKIKNIRVGLDLSINSTGVTVIVGNKINYHIITGKLTRKQEQCDYITYHHYDKWSPADDATYIQKEQCKTHNIHEISTIIKDILFTIYKIHKADEVCVQIEGVAFGASGDVVGLAGLNYQVRYILLEKNISFNIISPMQLKKAAVGNGGADKDVIIDAFQRCTGFRNPLNVKVDDVADAYFLAICEFD